MVGPTPLDVAEPEPLAEPVVVRPGSDSPMWDTASARGCWTALGSEPVAAAATPPPTSTSPAARPPTLAVRTLASMDCLLGWMASWADASAPVDRAAATAAAMAATAAASPATSAGVGSARAAWTSEAIRW
jgi:hypothetical protein